MTEKVEKTKQWADLFGYNLNLGEKEKSTVVETLESQGLTVESLISKALECESQFMGGVFVRQTIRVNIDRIGSDVLQDSDKDKIVDSFTRSILGESDRKRGYKRYASPYDSDSEKFRYLNYGEFVEKSKPVAEIKKIVQDYLEPFIRRKEYQDLINLDKLPESLHYKDTHNLLKHDPNRKNPVCDVGHERPFLEIDNLEQPDPKIDEKIEDIQDKIKEAELVYLFGPRNNGKSRTVYEFLSRNFGIHMTATCMKCDGSEDLEKLIHNAKPGQNSIRFVLDFLNLIAIRTMVLEVLRETQTERGQPLKPWHWLIIQLMPTEIFKYDIFYILSNNLFFSNVIELVFNHCHLQAPEKRFPVFIDEIKTLTTSDKEFLSAKSFDECVKSLKNGVDIKVDQLEKDRPLINLIIYASRLLSERVYEPKFKGFLFILTGTSLPPANHLECESSYSSSFLEYLLSLLEKKTVYLTLGNFSEYEPFKEYIKRYTDTLDDRLPELFTILRGRYGYTACFLNNYLMMGDVDRCIEKMSRIVNISVKGSIVAHIKSTDYLHRNAVRDFVQKSPYIQYLLLEYLFGKSEPIGLATGNELIDEAVALVRCTAVLVAPTRREPVLAFSSLSDMIREIKIVEPLVVSNLHKESEDVQYYIYWNRPDKIKCVNLVYLEAWMNAYETVCTFNPNKIPGLMCEPFAPVLLAYILDKDYDLDSRSFDAIPLKRAIDTKLGMLFPYWIDCNQAEVEYSLNEFLAQDFAHGLHKYMGITLKRSDDLPTFMLVAEPKHDSENPRLVVVQVKNTLTNEQSHFDALTKWPEHDEKFGKTVRILIQLGNNDKYSQVPDDVIVISRDSILTKLRDWHSSYVKYRKSKNY